ncbi:hypothetical protein BaRGS_00030265 [Batillaria attramentaria]|uniref:Uncharacterized protein n=1 Tax=Batillaria attramentaria TaxID=370345 RepID=A0ABD0JTS9_9CAEN
MILLHPVKIRILNTGFKLETKFGPPHLFVHCIHYQTSCPTTKQFSSVCQFKSLLKYATGEYDDAGGDGNPAGDRDSELNSLLVSHNMQTEST